MPIDLFDRTKAAFCLVALLSSAGCSPAQGGPSIKVGVLLPYTGDSAAVASNLEQALLGVAAQVNQNVGDGELPIKLVIKDTHSTVARTDAALDFLLDEGVVAVLGPESAELALHLRPRLEEAGVAFISPFVSSGTQPQVRAPWFRIGPPVELQARALARDVLAQGRRSVVVLFEADDLDKALAADFETTFNLEGGAVLRTIELPPRLPSYASQLAALDGVSPEAIVLLAAPLTGAQLVNELSFLNEGVQRPLFLGPTLENEAFLRNTSPEALAGSRGIAAAKSEFSEAFEAGYRASWGQEAPTTGAYYFHDSMALLSLAIGVAQWRGTLETQGVASALRTVSQRSGSRIAWDGVADGMALIREGEPVFYQGLTGTMIVTADGERIQAATRVWTITNGRLVDAN